MDIQHLSRVSIELRDDEIDSMREICTLAYRQLHSQPATNLLMFGCDVNSIGLALKEGGTVEVSFRVQVANVEERILGKLAGLVQHEINIILTPPTVEEVGDVIKEMGSPFLNQAELDADISGEPFNPFPETPEQALMVALDDDESFDE